MTKHHTKSLFRYTILGRTLILVEQHMYLGVKLDHRLSWHPHIDYVCNKANKLWRFLKRNLQRCPKYFRELSYKQFIIPVLECCGPIWDPYHQSDIKWFSTELLVLFLRNPGGETIGIVFHLRMLADQQWPLLSQRRKCVRLTLLYKSLNKLLSIPSTYLPVPTPLLSTRSNHNQKFLHYHTSVDCYKFQEQYQRGMISLQELYNANQLTFLISICMNILLYNCMLHISPYAPGGLCWSQL